MCAWSKGAARLAQPFSYWSDFGAFTRAIRCDLISLRGCCVFRGVDGLRTMYDIAERVGDTERQFRENSPDQVRRRLISTSVVSTTFHFLVHVYEAHTGRETKHPGDVPKAYKMSIQGWNIAA